MSSTPIDWRSGNKTERWLQNICCIVMRMKKKHFEMDYYNQWDIDTRFLTRTEDTIHAAETSNLSSSKKILPSSLYAKVVVIMAYDMDGVIMTVPSRINVTAVCYWNSLKDSWCLKIHMKDLRCLQLEFSSFMTMWGPTRQALQLILQGSMCENSFFILHIGLTWMH